MQQENENPQVTRATYTEQEAAKIIGIDRTSVRRIAITKVGHPIAQACLYITDNKRVYSRAVIDAYVAGFKELTNA